ncbi:Nuclear transport factor 2 [Thelohanellus kitauei]|uniref:Nuclear transport factor 2 n=1 Tax=Thelohanellus kitauei TaxID=669202 RepID=A0A0C2N6N4_THEKT|nr:Nuclear transport factor 2 [Thelohanellus kitauei]
MNQVPVEQTIRDFMVLYYGTLTNNRSALAESFYIDQAILTYQSDSFQGIPKIKEKYGSLGFQKLQVIPSILEIQQTPGNMFLVYVYGRLQGDNDRPLMFSDVLILVSTPQGIRISNHVFSLIIADP